MQRYNDHNKILDTHQYDPLQIKAIANSFHMVAESCTGCSEPQKVLIPKFTNYSFASELYLKALLYLQSSVDSIKNKHNLYELYHLLLPQTRQRIFDQFGELDAELFDQKLRVVGDFFVECRYIFEYKKLEFDPLFIPSLADALKSVTNELIS